jgi:polyferredoxin
MQNKQIHRILRFGILLSILILVTVLGRLHSIIKLYPAIDAFCPFGGLESLFVFFKYDAFLKRIALSSMILFVAVILTAVVFRRSFCGNICPLGFIQELSAKLGRRILGKRFFLPARLDKIMRFIKYIGLVIILGATWLTFSLIFRPMDPWAAFHHIGSDELFSGYFIGFIILALSLITSFFLDRVFCKYLCPMGAFLAPVSKIVIFRIRNDKNLCTSCGACDSVCPMNIAVSQTENVTSAECINCMECISECPVNALSVGAAKSDTKKIKPWVLIMITVSIFIILVGITTFTKQFIWKAPTGLEQKTERLLWGPQRIKSDNSFDDIVKIFRINPAYLQQEFGFPNDNLSSSFKELNVNPDEVEALVNRIYTEAGLDPTRIYGGGSCGGH